MKRTVMIFALLFLNGSLAMGSGFPGQLDDFCVRAEYIVVATCTADRRTVKPDSGGGNVAAVIEVERVFKAPKNDPKPTKLKITGMTSSATRFPYQKGKRYFVFVFKNGFADRQGSCTAIGKGGKLDEGISGYHTGELICLEKNTNTLGKLTEQVESVLSGKYEKQLIANIHNSALSYGFRCNNAIALARTNPKNAVKPLGQLLFDISKGSDVSSKESDVHGSSRDVFFKLLLLDPKHAKGVSLQILSTTSCLESYLEAAEILARPECKLANFKEHYPMLIKAANEWTRSNPHIGYAYMLPVFINNNCRSPEVKTMLLAELSSPRSNYSDRICESAIKLQFPESLPLFWRHIKKKRLVSNLYNVDHFIVSHVGASTVYSNENVPQVSVDNAQQLIRRTFPEEYTKRLPDAEVVRVHKALLFFMKSDAAHKQTCLYVGFVRNKNRRIERKVFVLFGGK